MKFRYLALSCAAIILLSTTGYAQGPDELVNSAQRTWRSYSNPMGFSISLPDFFTMGTMPNSATVQYQPADTHTIGILLFVSRVGVGSSDVLHKRYTVLVNDLKHQEDTRIESKRITNTFYDVSSRTFDDDSFDQNGKEQKIFWYARGILTSNGVYEISLRYQPEYRKAVTAMLPDILASFDRSLIVK